MRGTLAGAVLLAAGHAFAAGCGDVTGDVIVRATPEQQTPGCSSDDDCAPPNSRCELGSRTCVACLGDGDCAAGRVCALPANVCAERCTSSTCGGSRPVCDTTGLCRACGSDAECPEATGHCLASGACVACVDHAECGVDDDGEPLFCNPAGRCVECLVDADCDDEGESCNPYVGECAQPCSETQPCRADDPICDLSIGFCVECRQDAECAPGVLCRDSECGDD